MISGIDITVPAEGLTETDLADILEAHCANWVFQKEKGEKTGYVHFQIRARLKKQQYLPSIIKDWQLILPKCHISATSNGVHAARNFCYVMKEDTRVEGPWSNENMPKHMTRQIEQFLTNELYPWQKDLINMCSEKEDRFITVIIDEVGKTGKSIMSEYLEYCDLAYEIPTMLNMEDIMQCCMGIPAQRAYLIDMPRGLRKEKLASFYAGLESLKNGTMYDKRYAFKKRRIDRPQVFVFTNTMPDRKLLSLDRWRIFRISAELNLVEADFEN